MREVTTEAAPPVLRARPAGGPKAPPDRSGPPSKDGEVLVTAAAAAPRLARPRASARSVTDPGKRADRHARTPRLPRRSARRPRRLPLVEPLVAPGAARSAIARVNG